MACDPTQQILNPFKNLDKLCYTVCLVSSFCHWRCTRALIGHYESVQGLFTIWLWWNRLYTTLGVEDITSFMTFMPFFGLEHNTRWTPKSVNQLPKPHRDFFEM